MRASIPAPPNKKSHSVERSTAPGTDRAAAYRAWDPTMIGVSTPATALTRRVKEMTCSFFTFPHEYGALLVRKQASEGTRLPQLLSAIRVLRDGRHDLVGIATLEDSLPLAQRAPLGLVERLIAHPPRERSPRVIERHVRITADPGTDLAMVRQGEIVQELVRLEVVGEVLKLAHAVPFPKVTPLIVHEQCSMPTRNVGFIEYCTRARIYI